MNALFKTLFGDIRNLGFVCVAIAAELAMVFAGLGREAAFAMPVILLSGIAWLATR
jgi:hypothetical protein